MLHGKRGFPYRRLAVSLEAAGIFARSQRLASRADPAVLHLDVPGWFRGHDPPCMAIGISITPPSAPHYDNVGPSDRDHRPLNGQEAKVGPTCASSRRGARPAAQVCKHAQGLLTRRYDRQDVSDRLRPIGRQPRLQSVMKRLEFNRNSLPSLNVIPGLSGSAVDAPARARFVKQSALRPQFSPSRNAIRSAAGIKRKPNA